VTEFVASIGCEDVPSVKMVPRLAVRRTRIVPAVREMWYSEPAYIFRTADEMAAAYGMPDHDSPVKASHVIYS